MNRLQEFLSRLRGLLKQSRDSAELDEEIAAHLDLLAYFLAMARAESVSSARALAPSMALSSQGGPGLV